MLAQIILGCSQVVRHWFLVPACVGSNPTTPAIYLSSLFFLMRTLNKSVAKHSFISERVDPLVMIFYMNKFMNPLSPVLII